MAITVDQQLAICRIYVPGTQARGTGFLIKDVNGQLCVLTAAHVVRKSANAPAQQYAQSDIELQFGPHRTLVQDVRVASFQHGVDAATLRLPAGADLPAGVEPYRLRPCARGYQIAWETFGYSDQSEKSGPNGQAYGGTIRTSDPNQSQLKVDQIHGSPAGLSGSPVIVDGQVVGVILKTADAATSETVFARCVSCFAGKLPEVVLEKMPVAWVDEATYLLKDFAELLNNTAVALKLASDSAQAKATIVNLPERVAEAMLTSSDAALTGVRQLQFGFERRASAGDSMPPADAIRIVNWSLRSWIDQRAALMLKEALVGGDRVIVLNTNQDTIAEWYVHRAGCIGHNEPGMFPDAFFLDVDQTDQQYLLAQLEDSLSRRGIDENERLDPLVVRMSRLPTRSELDFVRKEHPNVRFILLTDVEIPPHISTHFPDACVIDPRLIEKQIEQALAANKRANDMLRIIFKPKRVNGKQ